MSRWIMASMRGWRTIQNSASIVCTCSAFLWAGCGETRNNSALEPAQHDASGGTDATLGAGARTSSAEVGMNDSGTAHTSSPAPATFGATATTGAVATGTGGAPTTATTDPAAAGADPTGTGAGGAAEPDDDCEVEFFELGEDVCRVETRCPEFVQHTNCRSYDSEPWQCDTDEHDNSKPHTLDGNPGWLNTVTGSNDAAAVCDAVVAVNLKRPSVMLTNVEDCSEFSNESQFSPARFRLCGTRYQATSGATVWDGVPAGASCSASDAGFGQACQCWRTGPDDGEYRLDAADLDTALADVWDFCTNSSIGVPLGSIECDTISDSAGANGACESIDNCLFAYTDDSGLELDQLVYRELRCGRETTDAPLSCRCRIGPEREFSFRANPASGVSACEDLASTCDRRNTAERAGGPAECERRTPIVGRERFFQSYACSIPVTLGGRSGLALIDAGLQCLAQADGALSCSCYDDFTETTFPIEPTADDLTSAWELAVGECEALVEADPAEL